MKKKHTGSCHCGAVKFSFKGDIENERKAICNCSRCQRLGFLHFHVERSDFKLLQGFEHISVYKFETLSAEHMFCKLCGVQPFYRSRSDPNMMDINLRCVDKIDIYAMSYWIVDGDHWAEAQAARRKYETEKKVPPQYALLSECSKNTKPATKQAFHDSWHLK